jgi:hypothetical protein
VHDSGKTVLELAVMPAAGGDARRVSRCCAPVRRCSRWWHRRRRSAGWSTTADVDAALVALRSARADARARIRSLASLQQMRR